MSLCHPVWIRCRADYWEVSTVCAGRLWPRDNNTVQHSATQCNTVQHSATQCNTVQHSATQCNTVQHTATQCSTLQHTATHRKTWQHTHSNLDEKPQPHCNKLPNTEKPQPHCNKLPNTAKHCNTTHIRQPRQKATIIMHHTATHCNTLQHTATHCNTLKGTATHWNALQHTQGNFDEKPARECWDCLMSIANDDSRSEYVKVYIHTCTLSEKTVCCSVLQCVAVCCSVLQCVAVCCSVSQCVAVCCSVLQCVAVNDKSIAKDDSRSEYVKVYIHV